MIPNPIALQVRVPKIENPTEINTLDANFPKYNPVTFHFL